METPGSSHRNALSSQPSDNASLVIRPTISAGEPAKSWGRYIVIRPWAIQRRSVARLVRRWLDTPSAGRGWIMDKPFF